MRITSLLILLSLCAHFSLPIVLLVSPHTLNVCEATRSLLQSLLFYYMKNTATFIIWGCVWVVGCQEGVETHRWSGGSHSVRSGSQPALRLVGLTREAPPTGFWADLDLTQRFCFVTERHTHPWYHIVSASSSEQACHLCVHLTVSAC